MVESELVRTSNEMKPDIVCPLSLKIAIASDDRLGAIQSYRCTPRPNSGGWETRPQPKTDKWTADFYKVLHAPRGELVTLSDGKTQIRGLGKDENVKAFHFRHEDGVRAKERAIQEVKSGHLRAPRNWDRVFASDAGMTRSELESTYPDVYKTTSNRSSRQTAPQDDEEIQALDDGFLDDSDNGEGQAAVESEALDENDEAAIAEEEESWQNEGAPEAEHEYSVSAELELDDKETMADDQENEFPPGSQSSIHRGDRWQINLKEPVSGTKGSTLHKGCSHFEADMGTGELVTFYRVRDPRKGRDIWLREGLNEDFSEFFLQIR